MNELRLLPIWRDSRKNLTINTASRFFSIEAENWPNRSISTPKGAPISMIFRRTTGNRQYEGTTYRAWLKRKGNKGLVDQQGSRDKRVDYDYAERRLLKKRPNFPEKTRIRKFTCTQALLGPTYGMVPYRIYPATTPPPHNNHHDGKPKVHRGVSLDRF